jgi:hypothetical protein
MRRLVAAALLGLLPTAVLGADDYDRAWDLASAEHDRLIATAAGAEYEAQLLPVHRAFWSDVYLECLDEARKTGLDHFRALAVIDETGAVRDFLAMPNNPHFDCFAEWMVGKQYPVPPVAPFYQRFRIGLPAN